MEQLVVGSPVGIFGRKVVSVLQHSIMIHQDERQWSAVLYYPPAASTVQERERCRWAMVVISVGFPGWVQAEQELMDAVARDLSLHGFLVLKLSGQQDDCASRDLQQWDFATQTTLTRRMIDYGYGLDCVDVSKLYVLGFSVGALTAIHTASEDARVKALMLWSTPAYPSKDGLRMMEEWEGISAEQADSPLETDAQRSAKKERWLESLANSKPLEEVKQYRGDALFIHGTADHQYPSDYCFLYQRLCWTRDVGHCDKEVILQADHYFSLPAHRSQLLMKTKQWLLQRDERNKDWYDWII